MDLAIFDLDNTLLAGDSDFQWGQYLIEQGLLNREQHEAKNIQFYHDYNDGKLDIMAFLKFQLKPLSEHSRAFLDELHKGYMEQKVRPMMLQKAQELVNHHKARGDQLLVITATNSFTTTPIARAYGIDALIGTDPEQINGEFTGGVQGLPSFQEGKVTRLHQWLQARGETLKSYEHTWFYSDSRNDIPLLSIVDKPVAVDPDPTLRQHAENMGWNIMSLR